MNDIKTKLKTWLKESGTSREEFAQMVFVTRVTLDNWLSKKGSIPQAKQELIRKIISEYREKGSIKIDVPMLPINLPSEMYEQMEKEALRQGLTMREYVSVLLEYASVNQEALSPKIAEIIETRKNSGGFSHKSDTSANDLTLSDVRTTAEGLPPVSDSEIA